MKKLLILLLLLTVLLSGCVTSNINFGTVNVNSLIVQPEKYYNKEVTVRTVPSDSILFNPYYFREGYQYKISGEYESGKPISLLVKYDYFYCQDCEITGIVKSFKVCNCQRGFCHGCGLGQCNFSWENPNGEYSSGPMIVEKCNNETLSKWIDNVCTIGFRCEPGSESDVYYLDVTHVKKIS